MKLDEECKLLEAQLKIAKDKRSKLLAAPSKKVAEMSEALELALRDDIISNCLKFDGTVLHRQVRLILPLI